ncbi:MAG: 30S ribosomal protein S1 [Brevefilum fermentans]|jgi:small subunit ribosomal protein S1|uniref:Putative 30S ribosomal protein S1 n=1 Tax=Candidatus Brevifilum fermentans TaxID=1986204 RepID=A0A1Y6K4K0_9CHLR|nr:S1 RNA-binding domain-containing protein [Brevefilum fermentans]SMX54593.1 putative 30S ribosomal protein S1 [Brevefilum fermentans]HOM67121.1 S1 RNA-binding domain-containing protein [Brevefilum fermentans]
MKAKPGVGRKQKDRIPKDREHHRETRNLTAPDKLDDCWWISIGADQPLLVAGWEASNTGDEKNNQHQNPGRLASAINWHKVECLLNNDEIITLEVVGYNRGGILVKGNSLHGFVPASHLVDHPVGTNKGIREEIFRRYLGREIQVKVIECEPEKDRVVFSERAALAGAGKRKSLLASLAKGDIISGFVTNITDFGVFVDLGGVEGLIHVSELSWGRVQHPSEVVKLGQEIETVIVEVLEEQARIALSLKRLKSNPWDNLSSQLCPGDVLDAVVTRIVKYGVFACLDIGLEGLIHISTIVFPADCVHISDFLKVGQRVKVNVISIDAPKRRLGLTLEG